MTHTYMNPASRKPELNSVKSAKTASGINMVLGAWLVISPFLFGFSHVATATWNNIIVGLIVLAAGWVRMVDVEAMFDVGWVNFVAGLWLCVAPWAFGYYHLASPLWNDLTVGVIVFVVALSGLFSRPRHTTVR
jgi:hypothetical protein